MAQVITAGVAPKKSGIDAMHKDYKRMLPLWHDIRAVLFGKQAVVKLKLPMPGYSDTMKVGEGDKAYYARDNVAISNRLLIYLQRGQLLNATARTQASNTGMIWSQEPEDNIPTSMDWVRETLRDDVQKIVADVASVGRYGVLLDSDEVEGVTRAEQAQGIGVPKWVLYKAEQMPYSRDGEVRLIETYEKKVDELNYEDEPQIRRLVLIDKVYHNQVWRNEQLVAGMDIIPTVNGKPLDYIPFQYFGSEENSKEITKPPIYDLTECNLGHFMLDCDNRDNLHAHGQGMLNLFVKDSDEFMTANPCGTNTGAKGENQFGYEDRVEIVQIEATGAIPAEMLRDQERMIMIGAQLVQDSTGNQTLGAKKMEHGASISTLKQVSMNVSKGVTQLLNWQAEMTGVTADIVYTLNTIFITDSMTPEMLAIHLQMVQMGALPLTSLYESARQAQLTKKTDEELKQETSEQAFTVGGTDKETATDLAANEE